MHRRRQNLRLLVTVSAAAVLLTPPGQAQAHTDLLSSRPAAGERLADPPAHVVLEFARPVSISEHSIQVTAPDGAQRSDAVLLSQTARAVSVVLNPDGGADAGPWEVRYQVRGSDGHVITGAVEFGVDVSAGRPSPPLPLLPAIVTALFGLAAVERVLRGWARRSQELMT